MKLGIVLGRFTNKKHMDYSRFGDDCYKKIKEHGFDYIDLAWVLQTALLMTGIGLI